MNDGGDGDRTEDDTGMTDDHDTGADRASDGSDPGGGSMGSDGIDPEEMDIEDLREEIEAIDRELVELIARRTYVADTIAGVKERRGMATTDERQEERVMERAAENAERFDVDGNLVKAIFRLLIELNKIEQREKR